MDGVSVRASLGLVTTVPRLWRTRFLRLLDIPLNYDAHIPASDLLACRWIYHTVCNAWLV